MSTSQSFRNGHAVVIGIGHDLPMTVTDATAVARILTDPTRCGYPDSQVRLLVGDQPDPAKRPTKKNILAALDDLAARATADQDAIAIVYYSGHGGFGQSSQTYFFVPDGYNSSRFADTAITGAEFAAAIAKIKPRGLLVLLDCCHSAGLTRDGLIAKGLVRKAPLPPDLTALAGMTGRAFVASSQANEVSYGGTPYSIFTAALLEGLAGYGSRQRDGKAYFIDVLSWIGHEVPKRTAGTQNPILDFAQVPINFPLAYYAGGDLQPKSLEGSGPVPQQAAVQALGASPLPPLPETFLLVIALGKLLPGEFHSVITGLAINPAVIDGDGQLAKANSLVHKAGQDRSGTALRQMRQLILMFNPTAFD